MKAPIRLVILGAGDRGRTYVSYAAAYPDKARVVGVADINPAAAQAVAKAHNLPATAGWGGWAEAGGAEPGWGGVVLSEAGANTPEAVRIIKPHIANPMYCPTCLKFAVAVISSPFLIFLLFMRFQELRELSFKLSYLPLVYPTFFLCVFLSHRSFSFRVLEKVGIRECKVFRGNTTRRAGDFRRKQEA